MKRDEALTLGTTWMDPKNMMLSDRRRPRRTRRVIPLMGNVQNRQIHRHREWVPGCQGLGEEMQVTVMETGSLLKGIECSGIRRRGCTTE